MTWATGSQLSTGHKILSGFYLKSCMSLISLLPFLSISS
jgi:hypothetical protein